MSENPLLDEDNGNYRLRVYYMPRLRGYRLDINLAGQSGTLTRTVPATYPPAAGIDAADLVVINEKAELLFRQHQDSMAP